MRGIEAYRHVHIAFTVIGIAVMSAIGGATFAHTHAMGTTTIALLASAVGLALFGPRALRWWWGEMMLGLDDPYGEPSAEYERTTRARKLAPKLVRMIENAEGPVTVMVTGVELTAKDGTSDTWGDALRTAAHAGATIHHYLPPGTSAEEAASAQALADEFPRCRSIRITDGGNTAAEVYYPTLAWEGDMKCPRQALLWLEEAREPDEIETRVEFRNTRNLRRNAGMLEEFVQSVERAARRASNGVNQATAGRA